MLQAAEKNRLQSTTRLRTAALGALALWMAAASYAQSAAPPPLHFDVATVRPSRPNNPNSNINTDVGRFGTENVTLESLLQFVTQPRGQSQSAVTGAPAWVKTDRFDIHAKESEDTTRLLEGLPPAEREAALKRMVLVLLEERFALKLHMEGQPAPILALAVARGGPKMQPYAQPKEGSPLSWSGFHNDGRGHVEAKGATMAMLTDFISYQPEAGGRVVMDQTGLTGQYSFQLRWTPATEAATAEQTGLPSLTAALQETLGLELKRTTGPVQTVVVDHVEKPTAN